MKALILILGVLFTLASCRQTDAPEPIKISWVNPEGDFSFSKQWDYPEGVYRNDYGQLSCDGFCPEAVDAMKDSTGRIYKDSLPAFYALVDTTHRFHSLQGQAQCDEYAGADYMVATRRGDTTVCYSLCNAATHCSLHLRLLGDDCTAAVQLRSIASGSDIIFKAESGFIHIDPAYWKAGILKAEFDLGFGKDSSTGKPVSWKGKLYTPILKE